MTDNEIIKALECCKKRYNGFLCTNDCPVYDKCISVVPPGELIEGALNLINSQKAEIEKWRNAFMGECMLSACSVKKELQSEAIEEFAKRLKKSDEFWDCIRSIGNVDKIDCVVNTIYNIVKEMKEGK